VCPFSLCPKGIRQRSPLGENNKAKQEGPSRARAKNKRETKNETKGDSKGKLVPSSIPPEDGRAIVDERDASKKS